MRKIIIAVFIPLLAGLSAQSQSIIKATIAGGGGTVRTGNVILSFTLGETIVGLQSAGYVSGAITVYRYIGNGNFSDPLNWQHGQLPPNPLPVNAEVIIDPAGEGHCMLNIPFTVKPTAKFSVIAGKKLLIPQNLNINVP